MKHKCPFILSAITIHISADIVKTHLEVNLATEHLVAAEATFIQIRSNTCCCFIKSPYLLQVLRPPRAAASSASSVLGLPWACPHLRSPVVHIEMHKDPHLPSTTLCQLQPQPLATVDRHPC